MTELNYWLLGDTFYMVILLICYSAFCERIYFYWVALWRANAIELRVSCFSFYV